MSDDWPGTPVQTPASDKAQSTEDWPGTPVDAAPKADFSWKKTYQDIPTEIGNEASAGAADVAALGRRDEMGPIEGLMSVPKAVMGAARVAMSPITGAARSVLGHGMANLEHAAGTVINPEVAAKDDPEKMYETAKSDADLAMSTARPAGAPVKVPGLSTAAPHPTVPGAMVTTTPNPAYEWKGPVAAKPKPTGLVDQPETSEFFDSANNHYSNMRGFGVEIDRAPVSRVADNIVNELYAEGYRPRNSKVFDDVEELRHPVGQNHEISDIESVRKVLQRTAKDPSERDAARRAIGHIDDYLANLKNTPQDVVVNPHFAGRVSEEALAARGDYAVAKRSEDIDESLDKAQRQAASGGAGGNINNAIRQQLKSLRNNKRTMRGWSDAEKTELDNVIAGSGIGNAARKAGKFAPHGIVSTVMSAGAGHALMPGVGEVAVPAAGWIAKKIGDRITQAAATRLQNVVKARSPLGKQNSINAAAQSALAPPVTKPPRLLTSSVAAGLPHRVGIPQRLMIYPQRAEQDDQNKPTTAGFASGGAVHAHVQEQAGRVDTKPTDQQKEVGNYRKGHVRVHGLPISIENPKGSYREGKDANGKPWRSKCPVHYGYIKKTEGADGDHVDIYVGPKLKSPLIYVIDQHDHRTGKFDEHKAFLGFENAKDVRRTYHDSFTDGRAGDRLRHMSEMTVSQFKTWLKDGDTSRPLKKKELATGGRANFADGGTPNAESDTGGEIPSADTSAGPIPDTQAMFTTGSRLADKLLGTGGQERYQTWPEKLARSALDAPHAALTSETPITSEEMIAPAQDMAGMAGGAGLGKMGESAIDAATRAPSMRQFWKPAAEAASDTAAQGAPLAALEHAPKFYSGLEKAVEAAPLNKASGQQWLGTIGKGVKKEELEATGTQAFLEQNRNKPVTKQEVLDHVGANKVELGEVNKGGGDVETLARKLAEEENGVGSWDRIGGGGQEHYYRDARKELGAKFSSYQLPGGENYRERLLTLPRKEITTGDISQKLFGKPMANLSEAERDAVIAEMRNAPTSSSDYRSSHWDEPNVLVHRRTNEREVNGVPSLHVEEIQSDFMQDYRRQKTAISDAIDKDFDGIADKMVKAGAIKKVCD